MLRRATAALLLIALVLAGCSDDDGDGDDAAAADDTTTTAAAEDEPATEEPSSDAPATEDGACPYLATEALDEAFGSTFTVASAAEPGCGFQSEDLTILLTRIDIQGDPETYIEQSADTCEPDTVQMIDAGDAAFACVYIGPTATVFEGAVAISLGVVTADDEAAVVDGFAAVLPSVTFPA